MYIQFIGEHCVFTEIKSVYYKNELLGERKKHNAAIKSKLIGCIIPFGSV